MKSITRNTALGCLLVLAWTVGTAHAQFVPRQSNFFLNSGVANQAFMNAQMMNYRASVAQAYGGYYGGGFGGYGYGGLGVGAYNPYSSMGAGYGAGGYGAGGYGGGYGAYYYDPYGYAGYGQALRGAADYTRAMGSLSNTYEQSRLMREQYYQSRLDTKKKEFDLSLYIKANTPSYMENQTRLAAATLKRTQTSALPSEIASGKALNLLLDDLRKLPSSKKTAVEPMMLSEGVLARISVTRNTYGMGLLRDYGKFSWPTALQTMVGVEKRKDLDNRVKELVREANNNRLDGVALKDVRDEMAKIRADLLKKVNEISTPQYMDAKQFLDEFNQATIALEKGEAPVQEKYQRYVEGGKSVQDLVDYMLQNGLRFAPASTGDEFAYRAVYTTLAGYDVAMNSVVGTASTK